MELIDLADSARQSIREGLLTAIRNTRNNISRAELSNALLRNDRNSINEILGIDKFEMEVQNVIFASLSTLVEEGILLTLDELGVSSEEIADVLSISFSVSPHAVERGEIIAQNTLLGVNAILDRAETQLLPPDETADRIINAFGLTQQSSRAIENLRTGTRERGASPLLAQTVVDLNIDSMLSSRADIVSGYESVYGVNLSHMVLAAALMETGRFVRRVWITQRDERVCPICSPLDGLEVGSIEQFMTGIGQISFPPAHINCRCTTQIKLEI